MGFRETLQWEMTPVICHANRLAKAMQTTTSPIAAIMLQDIVSSSNRLAKTSPKNGRSNCSCPTCAIPASAKPRYQNRNPIRELKSDTYASESLAGNAISCQDDGCVMKARASMNGAARIRDHEITCQLPI